MQSLDSIQRRLGFDQVINRAFPHLICLPSIETHADEARTRQVVSRVLAGNRDVSGIYVLSAEARAPILAAAGNVEARWHRRVSSTSEHPLRNRRCAMT